MPKKERRWQAALRKSVLALSNRRLLERALDLAGGDDYDGAFTFAGEFEFSLLQEELNRRLGPWLAAGTTRAAVEVSVPAVVARGRRQFALD